MKNLDFYAALLGGIKEKIQNAQYRAVSAVNEQLILMYWEIGLMIQERQETEGWSAAIIPHLAKDLKNEFPEIKGFSERNLAYMLRFAKEYPDFPILQQVVAKLPWGHHILLIEKIKDKILRFWYMEQSVENFWSRDTLNRMIKSELHQRTGNQTNNFDKMLPVSQASLLKESLKDPYIFDFLTLTEPFQERELETELVKHIEKFLLELGKGFAFVGRQYRLEVAEKDFYIDLLFYHLQMRCFVVVDLKKGEFKPEYAGKMNFYCSAVDDMLRHPTDQASIGLILCEHKNKIIAEYALRDTQKAIGISEYELTRTLPDHLKSSLPSIEQIEEELGN